MLCVPQEVPSGADLIAPMCHPGKHHPPSTSLWEHHTPSTSLQDSLDVRIQGAAVGAHVPLPCGTVLTLSWQSDGRMADKGIGGNSSLTSFLCQLVRNRFPGGHGAERGKKKKGHTGLCAYVSACVHVSARGQPWVLLGICSRSPRKEHRSIQVSGHLIVDRKSKHTRQKMHLAFILTEVKLCLSFIGWAPTSVLFSWLV